MVLVECCQGAREIFRRWGWKLAWVVVASPCVAATFTHPREGYTVWYPDGWYLHRQPQIVWIEELRPRSSLKVRVEPVGGQAEGFLVSSCPPEQYVALRGWNVPEEANFLPGNQAELAVIRTDSKPRCESWFGSGLPDDGGASVHHIVFEDGRELKGWQVTQAVGTYSAVKISVCREEDGRTYLFRRCKLDPRLFLRRQPLACARRISNRKKAGAEVVGRSKSATTSVAHGLGAGSITGVAESRLL